MGRTIELDDGYTLVEFTSYDLDTQRAYKVRDSKGVEIGSVEKTNRWFYGGFFASGSRSVRWEAATQLGKSLGTYRTLEEALEAVKEP